MNQNSSITEIKGVGAKTAELFTKLGVYTVGDILLRFPKDYFLYPKLETLPLSIPITEGYHAIFCQVFAGPKTRYYNGKTITTMYLGEEGEKIQITWFNSKFIEKTILAGKRYVFFGRLSIKNGRMIMNQPKVMAAEEYAQLEGQLEPIYALTDGVHNSTIVKALKQILDQSDLIPEYLPKEIRDMQNLAEYNYALKQIHFPDNMEALTVARRRFVFDEFFMFILGMQFQKDNTTKPRNAYKFIDAQYVYDLMNKLPYALTNAQKRTLEEIIADMCGPYTMQRLIQGDVGSGKTIVAFLIMTLTAASGYQSAIMAPTEVLAKQHYETFHALSDAFDLHMELVLLTGSLTAKEKKAAYEKILNTPNCIIIGTHAVIQEKVEYSNLALVITDEQHRFGVRQRNIFSEKGMNPHVIVMSATPIPRTLAIILYGDLDISVIDEVPAKRLPIKNCVVNTAYRPKAYAFIEDQVKMGHQAYVICPLVEETENAEGENVEDYAIKLREYFGGSLSVGILHGKMKNDKKTQVMEAFARNEIQVLVSTTVVEVGVNVPNATVMMIEDANRFGLAQLHQLRGRVGRGDAQSYCIMINSSSGKNAAKRLDTLNKSNDGFFIAREDLKLRGPGDFFGIRQSGELEFQLADIYQDADVMTEASRIVHEILEKDPALTSESNAQLRKALVRFTEEKLQL